MVMRLRVPWWLGRELEIHWEHGVLLWLITLFLVKYWGVGWWSAVGVFGCILTHELGHVWGGALVDVGTIRVSLSLWGGCTYFSRGFRSPIEIFMAAGGGLLASFLLSVLAFSAGCEWLGHLSLWLGLFNSVPFLPFDGGTLVEGIVWAMSRSRPLAQKFTGQVSFVGATLFGFLGLVGFSLSITLGITGLFMSYLLLQEGKRAVRLHRLYPYVRHTSIAVLPHFSPVIIVKDVHLSVNSFVRRFLAAYGTENIGIVADFQESYSWLSLYKILLIPREKWETTTIKDCLLDEPVYTLANTDSLADAIRMFSRPDCGCILIKDSQDRSGIAGILSPNTLLTHLGFKTTGSNWASSFQRLCDLMLLETY